MMRYNPSRHRNRILWFPMNLARGRFHKLHRAELALMLCFALLSLLLFSFGCTAFALGRPLLGLQFVVLSLAEGFMGIFLVILLEQFWDLLSTYALLLIGVVDFAYLLRSGSDVTWGGLFGCLVSIMIFSMLFVVLSLHVFFGLKENTEVVVRNEAIERDDLDLPGEYERYMQCLSLAKLDFTGQVLMLLWINRAIMPIETRILGSFLGLGSVLATPFVLYLMRRDNIVQTMFGGLMMLPFPFFVLFVLIGLPHPEERVAPLLCVFFRFVFGFVVVVAFNNIRKGMALAGVIDRGLVFEIFVPSLKAEDHLQRANVHSYGAVDDAESQVPMGRMKSAVRAPERIAQLSDYNHNSNNSYSDNYYYPEQSAAD